MLLFYFIYSGRKLLFEGNCSFLNCRSAIHGRGLFCKRDIDAGEMVIEYAGEVIRGVLTDKREKYYESKVRRLMDIYLFQRCQCSGFFTLNVRK